jgi:hypothetical protein
MSGIFDKYISMLSGNSKSVNSKTNTQRYISTLDGHEIVIPTAKSRRSSSISSTSSNEAAGMMRNNSISEGMEPHVVMEKNTVKIAKTTPNNRVNF